MTNSVTLRPLDARDLAAVSQLHAIVFGPGRFARTAYRVREQRKGGASPVSPYCGGAFAGSQLIASVTLTPIRIADCNGCLLLGPLAVHPDYSGQGYGRALIARSIETARKAGIKAIILVGDEPYYGRFGFQRVPPGQIQFPGPVDQGRILGLELQVGALSQARGALSAA